MTKKRNRVKHPQGRLVTRTRELLLATDTPYIVIYRETEIPPPWLSQFANDQIPDPGVNKIEVLYTFLNGAPLALG